MTAKFTPGLWGMEKNNTASYGDPQWCHFGIFTHGPRYQIATTMGDTSTLKTQEQANARLIAAAPDMYAALKEYRIGDQSDYDGRAHGLCFGKQRCTLCKEVDALLAKVDGQPTAAPSTKIARAVVDAMLEEPIPDPLVVEPLEAQS